MRVNVCKRITNEMNVRKIASNFNIDSNPTADPDISVCLHVLLCHLDAVKSRCLCVKLATLTTALISFFLSFFLFFYRPACENSFMK